MKMEEFKMFVLIFHCVCRRLFLGENFKFGNPLMQFHQKVKGKGKITFENIMEWLRQDATLKFDENLNL